MVLWIPDWPVNCLVVDLPPGGVGAVVHAKRIEVASASARRCGVRAGMSVREATYLCPELICLPRDPDREVRAFSGVIDAFDTVAAGVECLRPGLARCRARGPARWAGGEEQAASLLVDAIEEAVGVECFVGIADGPLASVEAARAGRIVPAEDTRFFLSGIGLSRALGCVPPSMRDRTSAAVDLLASLGITSCADLLQLGRGPVLERFGDVGERLWILASGGDAAVLSSERAQADITVEYDIDGGEKASRP
jgi:putative DNA repair polymerase